MKYLHHVSYLRLQDVIGARLLYCCLSGTTPGIISAFARCNWCVYHTINLICYKNWVYTQEGSVGAYM